MAPVSRFLFLPATLLSFLSEAAANSSPTAIKIQLPDPNEKLFPEHLAFAPLRSLTPEKAAQDALSWLEWQDDGRVDINGDRQHRPAFARHHDGSEQNIKRKAAEARAILEKRSSCPSGMNSCENIGAPNKCCQDGTYCTTVSDSSVGSIACCPNGATCGGGVGVCPSGATSCGADLGGGCCIPGYVCQGIGCVPSASATPMASTTVIPAAPTTLTTTQTTFIDGSPSTVIVTVVVTQISSVAPTTETTTQIVTPTSTVISASSPTSSTQAATSTATGVAPYRPTAVTSSVAVSTTDLGTQTGCPTGFYGCLATHGGGCCRTERDCATHSCPAPSSTIITDGATVVVPASNVPTATSTCANGWFLCGQNAGPVAGCCPTGFSCGTASCFTSEGAAQTSMIQKQPPRLPQAPAKNAARRMLVDSQSLMLSFSVAIGASLLSYIIEAFSDDEAEMGNLAY